MTDRTFRPCHSITEGQLNVARRSCESGTGYGFVEWESLRGYPILRTFLLPGVAVRFASKKTVHFSRLWHRITTISSHEALGGLGSRSLAIRWRWVGQDCDHRLSQEVFGGSGSRPLAQSCGAGWTRMTTIRSHDVLTQNRDIRLS